APCPGRAEDRAVLFGDDPEIPRSLPANEILRDERNRFCRFCMGFIGSHREKVPQDFEVILDSRTDHQIGHRTSFTWIGVSGRSPNIIFYGLKPSSTAEYHTKTVHVHIAPA